MKYIFIVFFLLTAVCVDCQDIISMIKEKKVLGMKSHRIVQDFLPNRTFERNTGQLVSEKEFLDFKKLNPDCLLEKEYDKYGIESKIYIDLVDPLWYLREFNSMNINIGDQFPPFSLVSIDGDTLDSELIEENYTLFYVYRSIYQDKFPYDTHKSINKIINASGKLVKKIVMFTHEDALLIKRIDLTNLNCDIVLDIANYYNKLHLRTSPVCFLIDSNGKVKFKFERGKYYGLSEMLR